MVEVRRYKEVADIYTDYLDNPVMAIEVLLKGFHWSDAKLLAMKSGNFEMIETHMKPAISNCNFLH